MLIRLVFFAASSLLVTIGLFLLMTSILHRDDLIEDQREKTLAANFLMPERKIDTLREIKKPTRPETKPEQEPEPQIQPPTINASNIQTSIDLPHFSAPAFSHQVNISLTLPAASGDGDVMPLLKVAPLYPQRAARRKLEGYVVVEYTVTRSGKVRDVKVVDAKPADVFNRSAIEAARKFKYKPRTLNGELVEVAGIKNKFIFRLEQASQ